MDTFKRNVGSSFFKSSLAGNKSMTSTPRTFARNSSSQSGTRRNCDSSLASDSRLTSQFSSCNLAASASCVSFFLMRNRRTWGPTRLSGAIIQAKGYVSPKNICSFTRTVDGNLKVVKLNAFSKCHRENCGTSLKGNMNSVNQRRTQREGASSQRRATKTSNETFLNPVLIRLILPAIL